MSEKRFFSIYETEELALGKIEELRAKGYKDSDIYVVSKRDENISILSQQTDVHTETSQQSGWFDKVRSLVSGEKDVRGGLSSMGLSDEEVDRHYNDLEMGRILIYVDEDYERRHNERLQTDAQHDKTRHSDTRDNDGLTIDSEPYNDPKRQTSHQGNHTSDGLEIDSKPFTESTADNPNRAVDPEQDRLDRESNLNDREAKLRGLDDRALRNDFEDPDNIRRF